MVVMDPVVAVRRRGQGAAVSAGVMGAAVGDISVLEEKCFRYLMLCKLAHM